MYLIGDVHGKTERLASILKSLDPHKPVFQLGDMGLGFKGVLLPHYNPFSFSFIRGNHDSPSACAAHPCYAGDYGVWRNAFFFLGGAWSIDYMYRTYGVSWWPDEELSPKQFEQATKLYAELKPRVVVTHEAPLIAGTRILTSLSIPFSVPDNPTNVPKDQAYKAYKNSLGVFETRTAQALQNMLDIHVPEKWYFGHYHISTKFNLRGCDFQCLNELEVTEIESTSSSTIGST